MYVPTSDGLCKQSVVIKAYKTKLHCEVLTGDKKKSNVVYISRITLDTTESTFMPFISKRLQFPVRLAFAMMINKSHGQSFDNAGLFVTCKETYVAFLYIPVR